MGSVSRGAGLMILGQFKVRGLSWRNYGIGPEDEGRVEKTT